MPNQHTSTGRTRRFALRLTDSEWQDLERRAAARGVSVSEIVREALGFAAAEPIDHEDQLEARANAAREFRRESNWARVRRIIKSTQ
jgi:uncharacterized protein (DUF1778 family)